MALCPFQDGVVLKPDELQDFRSLPLAGPRVFWNFPGLVRLQTT